MKADTEKFGTHVLEYSYDGADWIVEIKARNADDAEARIARLAHARYLGERLGTAPTVLGPGVAIITWARNLLATLLPRFG